MAHQPQNLVATAVSTTEITLSWDDVDTLDGESFDIERDGVIVQAAYAGGTTYSDTGLDPNTSYTYRVRAVGGLQPEPLAPPVTVAALTSILVPVVAVTADISVTPTTVSASTSISTPAVPVEPGAVALVVAVPTPGVAFTADMVVTPGTTVDFAYIPSPAILVDPIVLTTIASTVTIPSPTVTGTAVLTPATIADSTAVLIPVVTGTASAAPTTVAATATIPTPTVSAGGDSFTDSYGTSY